VSIFDLLFLLCALTAIAALAVAPVLHERC
jgi:hypothetical protein